MGNPAAEDCKEESQPRDPEDELFLKGGNRYIAKTPPPEDNASSKFDESWPSSERPSSVGYNYSYKHLQTVSDTAFILQLDLSLILKFVTDMLTECVKNMPYLAKYMYSVPIFHRTCI